jgi:hypothetical protein
MGTPLEIIESIGGKVKFEELVHKITDSLYAA